MWIASASVLFFGDNGELIAGTALSTRTVKRSPRPVAGAQIAP